METTTTIKSPASNCSDIGHHFSDFFLNNRIDWPYQILISTGSASATIKKAITTAGKDYNFQHPVCAWNRPPNFLFYATF